MSSEFKEILLQESGLLSLSQGDCDLFLIGQANAITYHQLALTGLHGNTATAGRLSIKRLEKEGYVTSRFLPGNAREKYYILTARGRKRITRLFDSRLPHRIHTGDIYFVYLASKLQNQLPVWQIEVSYDTSSDAPTSPRCDGLLQTGYGAYYIEQDDGTQGDAALKIKIGQYLKSDLFLGEKSFAHSLIFTLHMEARERPVCRPPYSIYRILLKAIRVWGIGGRAGPAAQFRYILYTFIIQYIREDLLGKGRDKMEDQSRGTRNIINEFLLMPANREIFCSQNSIDFDRALANGEVTVCNYNLASGDTDAVAFGLFFLLSFNNAVLSRPGTENTRIPHFFYLDELPVLIHPSLEKNFSLFRKFRVSMMVAIQTLDQMEKNEITKYLKGVILGCAHIIVFGRSSLSDMEIFSSLAGVRDVQEEQTSTTETALTDDSPHFSFSSREMMTQKNAIEEIDIRMKDFQEVTFFTTRAGRPLPALAGIVNFLKPSDWETKKRSAIFLSGNIAVTDYTLQPQTKDLKNTPPAYAEDTSAYRFLQGTPLSFFHSSSAVPDTDKAPEEAEKPKKRSRQEAKILTTCSDFLGSLMNLFPTLHNWIRKIERK